MQSAHNICRTCIQVEMKEIEFKDFLFQVGLSPHKIAS